MNSVIEDNATDKDLKNKIWQAVGIVKNNMANRVDITDYRPLVAKVYRVKNLVRIDIKLDIEKED